MGKNQKIVTSDIHRQSYLPSFNNQKTMTIVEYISGNGSVLPPMIILPGIMQQQDWFTNTGIPNNYLLAILNTGYSNNVLLLEWLQYFDQYSALPQGEIYQMLLLDGYGSHCTYEFIPYYDEKKIISFCLPRHMTHFFQLLERVVF